MTASRPRYDHTRDMADAGTTCATIVWLCLLLGGTGIILAAIGLMTGNHSVYVHPELPHPAMLSIHWS
jgi:hypothetical protein